MKKTLRIVIPIILSIAIILCMAWYLFIYDREFTRDVLLSFARFSESQGNHSAATWFYNQAYTHSGSGDDVAIELAEQYISSGNYTKAEFTLSNAIADGCGIDVYIALCKTYIAQDKLLDAVNMLNNVTDPVIKEQLDSLRPTAPTAMPNPGFYSQYISVSVQAEDGTIYATNDGSYPSTNTSLYSEAITLGDGENTVYAVTIGKNGLVSPLATFGYTVGGVVEKMTFADPAVEAAVRSILNVADDKVLYTNDLWTITAFTMPSDAAGYADLKHMPFLESLTIENGVSDGLQYISSLDNLEKLAIHKTAVSQETMKAIASRPKLKELTLQNCSITGIAPLASATALEFLDLNNNTIRNIDSISAMKNLQELNLQHNAVEDLSALSVCSALKKLDISYNSVTTLSPISGLSGLTWLDAGTNSITSLGSLEKLTALTYLSLASNKITDVTAVANCSALTDLNISSNALTDISSLSKLSNLMRFNFSRNEVSKIPEFSKDCALVTIDGSNNKISSLQPLSGLENLNNVHMDYNRDISSVSALSNCPVLIEVNVYATKVTNVTVLTDQSIIVNYNPVQ